MLLSTKVDLDTHAMRNCNGDSDRHADQVDDDVSLIQRLHCLSKLGEQIAKIEN